jgi:hypothetical protein
MVGGPEERARALVVIDDYLATQPPAISGAVPVALIWLGEPQRALTVAERPTRNDTLFLPFLWTAAGRNARALPEFSVFLRRSGLAEYWDRYGLPDLCAKSERGEYVCD